jgi:thymidine kinase
MSIEMIVGPMFAGKTKTLLQRIRELEKYSKNIVLCITHTNDDRYGVVGKLISHDRDSHGAIAVSELMPLVTEDFYKDATHIIIEESQFFPDLFPFVTKGADIHGKHFVCAGLDGDFQREPFGQVMDVVPHCDRVVKLKANCPHCSERGTAIFSMRLRGHGSTQVYIGGTESYQPMCRKHYIDYSYR